MFSPNAGKFGENADQTNSEYGLFLRSDHFQKNLQISKEYIDILNKNENINSHTLAEPKRNKNEK